MPKTKQGATSIKWALQVQKKTNTIPKWTLSRSQASDQTGRTTVQQLVFVIGFVRDGCARDPVSTPPSELGNSRDATRSTTGLTEEARETQTLPPKEKPRPRPTVSASTVRPATRGAPRPRALMPFHDSTPCHAMPKLYNSKPVACAVRCVPLKSQSQPTTPS